MVYGELQPASKSAREDRAAVRLRVERKLEHIFKMGPECAQLIAGRLNPNLEAGRARLAYLRVGNIELRSVQVLGDLFTRLEPIYRENIKFDPQLVERAVDAYAPSRAVLEDMAEWATIIINRNRLP